MHLLEDETRASLPPHLRETQKRVGWIFLLFLDSRNPFSGENSQDLFDFLDDDADGYVTMVRQLGALRRRCSVHPHCSPFLKSAFHNYLFKNLQNDFLENLEGLRPAASEEEIKQLLATISHGARGELVGYNQLASWIDEMEDRAREFQPKGSSIR